MIYWPLLNMYKSRYYNRLKNYLSYCGTAVCNADYNNAIRLQNKNNSSTSTLTTTLLMRITFRYTCLPFSEEYCCRDHTTDKCEFTFETLSACNSDFCLNLFACFTVKWQKQRYTQPPLSRYPTLPYPTHLTKVTSDRVTESRNVNHYIQFLGSLELNPSSMFVNSQLVAFCQLEFLTMLFSIIICSRFF